MKICVSDRCFFPKSAFMSNKAVVGLAKSLGYNKVEFHPTWAVCWEILTKGRLSCKAEDISSFHIDWRQDRIYGGDPWFKRLTNIQSYLFPPTKIATKTLQKLERLYKRQVVIHWEGNIGEYKDPILELHSFLDIGLRKIKDLVKEKKIKGVVVDTDKLAGWLERHKEKENRVLKKLLPDIYEIHFRFGYKQDINKSLAIEKTHSARILKKLLKLGFEGRVVVEMGWPDKGSVAVLKKYGLAKVHKKVVEFLNTS